MGSTPERFLCEIFGMSFNPDKNILFQNSLIKIKNMLREISKLIIFVVAFAMPVIVARMFDSPGFLWLYGVSAMFVLALHNHYETLERIDIFRDNYKDDNDERDSSAGN